MISRLKSATLLSLVSLTLQPAALAAKQTQPQWWIS
jgi:hypothetical protein